MREPRVGLARVVGAIGRSFGASASTVPAAAAVTWLVNGFQSRCGLSITARGIVCVTMRSITFAIVRCFATPSASA